MNAFETLILNDLKGRAAIGGACPSNKDLARSYGRKSGGSASWAILALERAGAIVVRRRASARVIVVDGVELHTPPRGKRARAIAGVAEPAAHAVVAARPVARPVLVLNDLGPFQQPAPLPAPVSLTARLMGDPLPGRSALDRRRAGL